MLGKLFEHIIVIGHGVLTGNVLKTVHKKSLKWNYSFEYIEHEVHSFNSAKKYAIDEGIEYHVIEDKNELFEYFVEKICSKTLIVSAGNNYIFPTRLVSNNNVSIVNLHDALLPDFPGRNAPSWAIFEQKKRTGITWHYVTESVDAGDIIIQKECVINEDIRAYELVARQMQLASEAFDECYDVILGGNANVQKQVLPDNRRIYKSYEVPANGKFDMTDSAEYIYRLLRSLDYGKNQIFPMPETQYNGGTIRVRQFKKMKKSEMKIQDDVIYLSVDDDYVLMMRYDVLLPDMIVSGGIDDVEYLYELVRKLKAVKRRLVSNMYLKESDLEELIKNGRLHYEFASGRYLNVWYEERGFARLFFYIVRLKDYQAISIDNMVICDLIFQKSDDGDRKLIDTLSRQGFIKYAEYHRWIRKHQICENFSDGKYNIGEEYNREFFELLKESFDIYSDYIPEESALDEFFKEKVCYSVRNPDTGQLIGGMVITVHGGVQTEEFVFVDPKDRGKGIASLLHQYWYEHCPYETVQYIAWINESNEASKLLHLKFAYVRQSTYKITMKKEIK